MLQKISDILVTSLNVSYNYSDSLIKLFLDLYLVKFLDTSARSSFHALCYLLAISRIENYIVNYG